MLLVTVSTNVEAGFKVSYYGSLISMKRSANYADIIQLRNLLAMFCLAVILILLNVQYLVAISDTTIFGVDDWSSQDLSEFFKTCGVIVSVETIESTGLTPSDLFDGGLTPVALDVLGVPEKKRDKVLAEAAKLDDRITAEPSDIFEWRITNRKMFYWLQDMTQSCPRITLLWLRYAHNDKADALDTIDDLVDEISETEFWFWWVFSPYTFFVKAADSLVMEKSWADEFIKTYFYTLSFLGLFSWLYAGELHKRMYLFLLKMIPLNWKTYQFHGRIVQAFENEGI
jgi:hypothetical protein